MKTTKRALFSSVVALILCFSMLVGTTFAWFTDEATSANNVIIAGNLDIELEYAVFNDDGTFKEWKDVKDQSDILTNLLWEPGVTEVAYLRVANAGSLALKYQLGINIVSETEGTRVNKETGNDEQFKLSGYIQFGVVENVNGETGAYANREAAIAAVTDAKKISAGYTKATSMTADADDLYLALVVWMPTTVGNEANYKTGTTAPQIDLGINIFATQLQAESDSFGPDYDENAWHPEMQVYTADDLVAAISTAPAGTVISVENDIEVDGDLVIPAAAANARTAAPAILDLNGNTLTAHSVSAEQYAIVRNGTIELPDDGYVFASDDTAIELENVKIVSDGISAYAVRNGKVSLKDVVFVNTATSNPIQNYGGTMLLENVTVAQNGDAATAWYSSAIQIINLIGMNEETGKYEIKAQANTTITSGEYTGKKAIMISAPGGNVTINGGTFVGTEYAIQADFAPNNYTYGSDYTSIITINGGVFEGGFKMSKSAQLIIKGGHFDNDPSAYVADGSYVVKTADGWMVLPKSADKVYPADYESLINGKNDSNDYVLTGDVVVLDKLFFGDNTTNSIDLNGNTVTTTGTYVFATQGAGCELTVNGDGTVVTNTGYAALANKNSTLTINGGTYELGSITQAAHLYVQNSATLVINGGTYISTDADTPIAYCINGFIEINGGFFQNTANPKQALLSMGNNLKYANNQKITLSGGTFVNWNPLSSPFAQAWTNPDVPALIVLADGYTMVYETQENGDIWYMVVPVVSGN